jgi:hypothetical protein
VAELIGFGSIKSWVKRSRWPDQPSTPRNSTQTVEAGQPERDLVIEHRLLDGIAMAQP